MTKNQNFGKKSKFQQKNQFLKQNYLNNFSGTQWTFPCWMKFAIHISLTALISYIATLCFIMNVKSTIKTGQFIKRIFGRKSSPMPQKSIEKPEKVKKAEKDEKTEKVEKTEKIEKTENEKTETENKEKTNEAKNNE